MMPRDNIFCDLVAYTYSLDTNTNVFPSVHGGGRIDAWFAIWHTELKKRAWRWSTAVYGVLVIASTMFIKQHAGHRRAGGPCGGISGQLYRIRVS